MVGSLLITVLYRATVVLKSEEATGALLRGVPVAGDDKGMG